MAKGSPQRFGDLRQGQRVGRFNRLKEHIRFSAYRTGAEHPPAQGVIYFSQEDLSSVEVDLRGAKIVLARGPCLPPREELDDYLALPPLGPIVLANVLSAHGASVELPDLLLIRRRRGSTADRVLPRQEWAAHLNGKASPRLTALINELIEDLRPGGNDAVCLSMETAGDIPVALSLTREIRRRFGIPTIIGGRGVVLPEPLMKSCPEAVIVHGEGEIPLLLCLDAIFNRHDLATVPALCWSAGGAIHTTHVMIHDLDVRPTFDLIGAELRGYRCHIELEGSGPIVPYQYSIGCPFLCGYCNTTSRRMYRLRSPAKIVADLTNVVRRYGVMRFHMLSHLLNADSAHLEELLSRLEKANLGIFWSDSCRPAGVSADMLKRMRRAGASVLTWGVDCGSARLARLMKKGVNHDCALAILKASHRAGIRNIVNIIIGMPHETQQDIEETLRFIDRAGRYVHELQLPTYRFDSASLLARNPRSYGLLPGRCGGVDEPDGLCWDKRVAMLPALARRVRRRKPMVLAYDLPGRVARLLTGPTARRARRLWRPVKLR